jgi:hypothetical protein
MGMSEKNRRTRKGVKIRIVGKFFLALTNLDVTIPKGIPTKKETNNNIPNIIQPKTRVNT